MRIFIAGSIAVALFLFADSDACLFAPMMFLLMWKLIDEVKK